MSQGQDSNAGMDLALCLQRVREKDEDAARELVEHLYPLVIKIVRSHLPRRVAEEDLAQEIFMKTFARLSQYSGTVPLPHWVSRIALNTCRDHLRAQKIRPEFRLADLSQEEATVLEVVLSDNEALAPDLALGASDLVERLLERLGADDRMILRLLDMEGNSIEEIRDMTGWNMSLIKVRAFRARRKLRKFWTELEKPKNL